MRQPQVPTETHRLETNGSNIATAIRRMSENNDHALVLEAMQKIVPGLREIGTETAGRYLTLVFSQEAARSRKAEFAGTEKSEGSLRALGIIVAARQMTRDELLIIEEPEVNIHPGAAAVLVDVLKDASTRGAVLLTMHSPELLDAAGQQDILVCDYRDGVTRIGPLAESQRDMVRRGLFSVAELMRSEPFRIEGDQPQVLNPNAPK